MLTLPDHLNQLSDPEDEDFEIDSTQLTRRMKHLNGVINHFWRRWRREYLAELRESHRYLLKKSRGDPHVAAGDIVIVQDESLPRSFWKLGRARELIIGKDSQARGAKVTVVNRKGQSTTLNRPLQCLYQLEISHPIEPRETNTESLKAHDMKEATPCVRPRPRRAAARRCDEIRQIWLHEMEEELD